MTNSSLVTTADAASPEISGARLGWFDGWLRGQVARSLQPLRHGRLEIADPTGLLAFGEGDEVARIDVANPRFHRRVSLGGSIGAAESYLDGDWSSPDLVGVVRLLLRNLETLGTLNGGLASLLRTAAVWGHRLAKNTKWGSRRNIAAHYDLGNDFFRLFLDSTLMYSSAIFADETTSLEQASVAKLDRICERLELGPGDHVVEIGTGWGGFALHAAGEYGCRVTTTTISAEQYDLARQRVADAGLEGRVTVLKQDYRDLRGMYDKLVSIEMIEAVGREYLETYFATCERLLRPGGRMLVQAITMPEQRFDVYARSVDFIQKYVFPGGFLPSVETMQRAVGRATSLRLLELADFGHDYARTLREWRVRFEERESDVRLLGFDDRFVRLWTYYLCYCEAAFLERAVGVAQFCWAKSSAGHAG